MNNKVFGEIIFNVGWKTKSAITLFKRETTVVVKAKAYREEDGISSEQEKSYLEYTNNKQTLLKSMENMLSKYSDNAANRFVPKTLLFERDGSWALLCDDLLNPDEGIAICMNPEKKIVLQDDYL